MTIKILEIGDILRNKKTNKLHQITNITTSAIYIKIIGDMLATPIRYTDGNEVVENFTIEPV
jgi:hypothetical protein